MQILKGHISPETAYVVADYPYGFTLRCKIRYWLEYRAGHGYRLCSQTTNPKRPSEIWNKPKASTYAKFGAAMFLDENDHVQWSGLSEYCSGAEAQAWLATYGDGVPENVAGAPLWDKGARVMRKFIAAKVAYDAHRESGDPLAKGLPEARQAFSETE